MGNPHAGEVTRQALGKEWTFRLGVNEMLTLQAALGLADQDDSFLTVFDEKKMRNLGRARMVVVHALKRAHPEVTEEQAGDIIVELGLMRTLELLKDVLKWALPEKKPAGGAGGEAPRPSVGPTFS